MPRNIVGPPVAGDDFFGREHIVADLEARVARASVLLMAPRRWGKTSLLHAFCHRQPARRHYFDLSRVDSAASFVAEVATSTAGPVARVRRWIRDVLGHAVGSVDQVQVGEVAIQLRHRLGRDDTWLTAAPALLRSFPSDHILVFDEFPVLAKAILDRDPADARQLLRVLRHERQREDSPRLVLAGSTSLPELCRQAGLSDTINDLQLLPLRPFDDETARALLRGVFGTEGLAVAESGIDAILAQVGPEVPFFLQVMASAVRAEARETGARVTPALVRRLYNDVLLGAEYRAYLDDFHGRLDRAYLPPERDVAVVVLDGLAHERDGLRERDLKTLLVARGLDDRLLDRVLTLLRGDFYVSQSDDGAYRFLNRYLADWWRRFHA